MTNEEDKIFFSDCVRNHRELWHNIWCLLNELSDEYEGWYDEGWYDEEEDRPEFETDINELKETALSTMKVKKKPILNCFCCDYAKRTGILCHNSCPLDWGYTSEGEYRVCGDSFYDTISVLIEIGKYGRAADIAELIEKLPIKQEYIDLGYGED